MLQRSYWLIYIIQNYGYELLKHFAILFSPLPSISRMPALTIERGKKSKQNAFSTRSTHNQTARIHQ